MAVAASLVRAKQPFDHISYPHFSPSPQLPLSSKISLAAFVFDSLTTTKSITTQTASKAGLFLELQYDDASAHPTLIGGKLLDHRLERTRISNVPTGERSFHALYYLLAGTSDAGKGTSGIK